MKMDKVVINLPKEIAVLREYEVQDIAPRKEEFSLYFKNIIYPLREEYDIVIDCDYGMNLGHCWRICDFKGVAEEFLLTVKVYAPFGELICSKSTKIVLAPRNEKKRNLRLLCIGDSMTNSETYIVQAVNKARNITSVGTRSTSTHVFHEGRGGWTIKKYFEDYFSDFSVSPFLFPKHIEGRKYYGQLSYFEKTIAATDEYRYRGFNYGKIKEGMYYLGDDKKLYLFENGEGRLCDEEPEFEFDFDKYLERFEIERPDVISILFGGNELQISSYEEAENRVEDMLFYLKKLVGCVSHKDGKIIINLPACGAEQYAWGTKLGCAATQKQYDYKAKMACARLIEEFDGREDENIYICPMGLVLDPEYGFDRSYYKANSYSEQQVSCHNNWVHPCKVGYMQMGDALAAVLNKIRSK